MAGPWCTKLLADYGADVIKVERPGTGDVSRGHGAFPDGPPHREKSALFLWLNTSKRSVTLDAGTATGRALALRIAGRCDAVVVDRPPAELERLQLTPDHLRADNDRLVVTCVTAFGQSGPYAGWRSTNAIAYAAGGQYHITGNPEREPLLNGGYQAEYQAGTWAFGATLAALWQARERGEGQVAEVAGVEAMASILEFYLPDYVYRRSEALTKRRGNFASAAVGIYPAADGYIGIHCMPKNWPQFVRAIEAEWMSTDERFADNRARLRNDDELSAQIYAWAAGMTKRDAYRRAGEARAPITPVNTVADLLTSEHLNAREFFREIEHPDAGSLRYPGRSSRMPASPAAPRRAPRLGEHNAEVLMGLLGLSARDLASLSAAGVI